MLHHHAFRFFSATVFAASLGCHARMSPTVLSAGGPPALIVGEFEDDYGGRHTVSVSEWVQGRSAHYHVLRWVPEKQYFIARNDSANTSDAGRFTRIDWVPLTGMPPYEWAFCFSAYSAPTAAAAESTSVAHRETPRTGCNGFPFSRMRRVR